MNSDKRLTLAIALTFVILFGWSLLTPRYDPPAPSQVVSMGSTALPVLSTDQAMEAMETTAMGPCVIGSGKETGNILSLKIGEDLLLEKTAPVFLQVLEETDPGIWSPVTFSAKVRDPSEISATAVTQHGIRMVRRIFRQEKSHPNLFYGAVELKNPGSSSSETKLRIGIYQPLVATQPDQRYLMGTAWVGNKEERIQVPSGQSRRFEQIPTWVVSQNKMEAIIVEPPHLSGGLFHVEHLRSEGVRGWLETPILQLKPGEERKLEMRIYLGSMVLGDLNQVGMGQTLSFGAFSGITRWLLNFLHWGQRRFHNYGWAILLLSISVWLPFSPLTWYGMRVGQRTAEKMTTLKAQESRLRREHAGNPAKMQQELMAMYRKHGVNPAAGCVGCLPLLLTWPIYIALFEVLNRAPELRGAPFLFIRDLAAPDGLIHFPMEIPIVGSRLNVLPILLGIVMMAQQRTMQRPQLELTEEQKIQQQMFKIFPAISILMFYSLPAGFMLYWIANSMLMTGQQFLLAKLPNRQGS